MKNENSFLDFLKFGSLNESIVVNEATMNQSITGQKQADVKKPDPARKFNEQIDELTTGRWVGVSPRLVVGLMKFSPNWDDKLDDFSYIVQGLNNQLDIDNILIQSNVKSIKKLDDGEGGGYDIKIQFPGKKQGFLMPILKKNFPDIKLAFGGGNLTGNISDEKTMLNVFNAIMAIKEFQPKDKKDRPVIDNVLNSEDDIPQKWMEEYKNCITKKEGNGENPDSKRIMTGPIEELYKVCFAYNLVDNDHTFDTNVKWNSNTTLVTLDMLNLVDKFIDFKIKGNSPEQICSRIKSKNFGVIYRTYLKELEDKIDAGIADNKIEKNDRNKEIIEKINSDSMADILKSGKAVLLKGSKRKAEKPIPQTNPAKRRMKLFEDAEYYGAQIISNSKWIAAIVRDYDQAHTFGRLKPKVKPGTNEIDPDCNLRADEGITEANRIRQESRDPYVQDGLGYDDLEYEGGWCVVGSTGYWGHEHNWTGWGPGLKPPSNWTNTCYFACKKAGELMPLIVYMDCTNGRLFCSNMKYSGGRWIQYDFNTELNGQNDGGINKKLENDPLFKEIYDYGTDLSFEAYDFPGNKTVKAKHWDPISEPPPKKSDENATVGDMLSKLDVTSNGIVVFKSKDQVKSFSKVITSELITSVKLDFTDGSHLFEGMNIQNLSKIDCSKLTDMTYMFSEATLNPKLDLIDTSNVEYFEYTFYAAKNAQWISGLDTSSALTINNMFARVSTHFQRKLVIPSLDLRSCTNADKAFYESPIEKIDLKNTNNITTAEDFIIGCYLLNEFPNLTFEKAKGKEYAIFDAKSAERIFLGCDTLVQKIDEFHDQLKKLDQFYFPQFDLTEDLALPIIRTVEDLDFYLNHQKEYKNGISLQPNDGSAHKWFSYKTVSLDIIDLQGVTNADYLFYNASIERIGKIINTQNIFSARYMFGSTNIRTMPRINLESIKRLNGIFDDCSNIKMIKSGNQWLTQFNKEKIVSDDEDVDSFASTMFGASAATMKSRFNASLTEYLEPIVKQAKINKVKEWMNDNLVQLDGKYYLVIEGSYTYTRYCEYKQLYNDIVPEIEAFQLSEESSTDIFSQIEIDFKNKPIDINHQHSIAGMFKGSTVKNFGGFQNAEALVETKSAFQNSIFDGDTPIVIDMKNVTNAEAMFSNCIIKCSVELSEMSNLRYANSMFNAAGIANTINVSELKLSEKLEQANFMFKKCKSKLQFDDTIEFKSLQAGQNMFEGAIIEKPFDNMFFYGQDVSTYRMFGECVGLKQINKIVATSRVDFQLMFDGCESLETIGTFLVAEGTDFNHCFKDCKNLTLIPVLMINNNANTNGMFSNCPLAEVYGTDAEYLKTFQNIK